MFQAVPGAVKWRAALHDSSTSPQQNTSTMDTHSIHLLLLSSGGYTISVCNKPTRSAQPCIPPGSLNRVPALAEERAGMSPLPGGR